MRVTGRLAYRIEVPFEVDIDDPDLLDSPAQIATVAEAAIPLRVAAAAGITRTGDLDQIRILSVDGDEGHDATDAGWRYV